MYLCEHLSLQVPRRVTSENCGCRPRHRTLAPDHEHRNYALWSPQNCNVLRKQCVHPYWSPIQRNTADYTRIETSERLTPPTLGNSVPRAAAAPTSLGASSSKCLLKLHRPSRGQEPVETAVPQHRPLRDPVEHLPPVSLPVTPRPRYPPILDSNSLLRYGGNPWYRSASIKFSKGRLLKHLLTSKEAARMTCPRITVRAFNDYRASMVERPALKPFCSTKSFGPTVSRYPTSRSARIFSKTFPIPLSKTISLYADGASSGRLSVRMRHSSPSSQDLGNCRAIRHRLNSSRSLASRNSRVM
ncbi:jg3225 [Pararge aegeria aegeria]|uniref:Jg3225 protein n=1 Tax=Pararge aegeria aegeria TaxID=348720 RepID=A0A8S4QSD4_9NEOP|nr:jg3225 [Pararge aegeria aegeria]